MQEKIGRVSGRQVKRKLTAPSKENPLLFHKVKLLHQALKKGKQFEIRKACRRLQQALEKERLSGRDGGGGEEAGSSRHLSRRGTSAKLSSHLAALKAAEVNLLQAEALQELGLEGIGQLAAAPRAAAASPPGTASGGDPQIAVPDEQRAWAKARILSSKCVRDAFQQLQQQHDAPPGGSAPKAARRGDVGPGADLDLVAPSGAQHGTKAGKEQRRALGAIAALQRAAAARKARPHGRLANGSSGEGPSSGGRDPDSGAEDPGSTPSEREDDFFVGDDRSSGSDLGQNLSEADLDPDSGPPSPASPSRRGAEMQQRRKGPPPPPKPKPRVKPKWKPKQRPGQRTRQRLAGILRDGRSSRPPLQRKPWGAAGEGVSARHIKGPDGRQRLAPGTRRPGSAFAVPRAKVGIASKRLAPLSTGRQKEGELMGEGAALHPSWAAKEAEKKKLAMAGTGKKTVFADDD